MNTAAPTILIVDDQKVVLVRVRAMLEKLGFQTCEALSGLEALEMVDRRQPDLVMTDLRMPNMDGLTLIAELQVKCPELPVIVLSASSDIREAVESVRRGAWDYVSKPVENSSALDVVIRRALERARLLRENRLHRTHLEEEVRLRTAELLASRERYRRLLDSVIGYVYTVNFRDGHPEHTTHNDGCEIITGYSGEEYAADPELWLRMVHEDDRPLVLEMTEKVLTADDPFTFVHRITARDGSQVWLKNTLVPHRDPDGRLFSYDGIVSDITERKIAEQTYDFLLKCGSEAEGSNFFRSLSCYLSSQLGMEFVCISRLEQEGQMASTLSVYAKGTIRNNVSFQLQDTPCCELVGKSVVCFPREVRARFPQDQLLEKLHAESYIGTSLWDSHGLPIGMIVAVGMRPLVKPQLATAVLQQVSVRASGELERMQGESTLRKLTSAVAQSPVSILICDTSGCIEFVNPKFTQVTGYEKNEVLGLNPRFLKTGHTPPEEYRRLWSTISGGNVWEGEFQNRKKSGELFWEHATISPIRNSEGVITNYLAIKEDITGTKKLEEQLRQAQKMEAIGQLAGGVAHDFNNILQVIMTFATLMKMDNHLQAQDKDHVEQILASAHRAAHLTSDLLTFSRKKAMQPKPCDLNDIVLNFRKFLTRIIGEDITLKTTCWEAPLDVCADSGQLEQILINLATNARDAMPLGGEFTVTTEPAELDTAFVQEHGFGKPGRYAIMTVSDSGSGMDKEMLEKIFEPFFTTKGVGKGTGLGLAIVYGIVKQHGGHIAVSSEPGRGTTFRIYLPAIDSTEKALDELSPVGDEFTGSETILVVEDEEAVRQVASSVLQRFGYHVLTACDGKEGVEQFTAHRDEIKLVLMDVIMPTMNGREAVDRIREIRPDCRVLYTSGYTADIIQERSKLGSGEEIVQKPVPPLELLRKVRTMLDKV